MEVWAGFLPVGSTGREGERAQAPFYTWKTALGCQGIN